MMIYFKIFFIYIESFGVVKIYNIIMDVRFYGSGNFLMVVVNVRFIDFGNENLIKFYCFIGS